MTETTGSRSLEPAFHYHAGLDGVRAFAVAAVLLFHGLPAALPGGFLGVDAFFVLSGFLITALLLAERERIGRIRLGMFWLRRARRLLPALLLMVGAVVVGARWFVPAEELAAVRTDALATIGYVANWRMIYRGGGYFETTAGASPLQHAWSLGIEEQFYLLWPLAVVGLRSRFAVGLAAGIGALGSTVAAAWLFDPADPDRAYFGTDTRAAALLIGCLAAAVLPFAVRVPSTVLAGAAVLAVAVVAAGWVTASGTDAWLYHGGIVALAAAVAVVLISVVRQPRTPLGRLLAARPLVLLGRISYGVYLWHWPLYAVLTGSRTGLTGPPLLAVRIAATIAVAAASYVLLERPVRRAARIRWRVAVPAAVSAAVAVAVPIIALPTVAPSPPAPMDRTGAAAGSAPPPGANSSAPPQPNGAVPVPLTRPGRAPGGPRVAVLGDSVAWTLAKYLPAEHRIWLINAAVQGCGIARLPDIRYLGTPHTNYPGCTRWDSRWRDAIQRFDPDVAVILLDRWELMDRRLGGRYQHVGDPDFDAYLTTELDIAWTVAAERGARVVMLTAPYTRRAERPDGGVWDEDTPQRVDAWNRLLATAAATHPARPVVLDLRSVVCPDGHYTSTVDGLRVRSDGLHFTPEGVREVIAPWLLPRLRTLAGAA
jgi:peptidoglycan/LPS O-acetylase OafA/YrhL